ncbi:23S rRNA (uracil(1939)-C(5))-methyltransferase RlmD [Uliginosibacterium sp. 31-16]|uniref:23S rRNA (uracil(1939)-C(5))-methyltransferase RlmD n=1 Tax=Uliginosibacterium sp. 31-16 TaxID=3068315 RepID=UPI00273D6C76|nr:23S rRNA (uracil(1939)-C(5))-methyltransferase RlmD [Uliginosibacterium sp. 31-16]MDP5241333.1 23S rRNA (uracil(1939)-C(5))-methyltransferase RlmD [Uliginosibacterium sp. 31-16]
MPVALVESLDHEGRGVARCEGKAVFIEGALPGEKVEYSSYRKKPSFEQATTVHVLRESPLRVKPRCPHFGVCGGCSMQHLDQAAQVAAKQRVLEDAFRHIAKLRPEIILPPIYGPAWGYRDRARLGVSQTGINGAVLIGFHEKKSSYIADMDSCEILPKHISALLLPLRELIAGLSSPDKISQAEIAIGGDRNVLVLRNLLPLSAQDETKLLDFGSRYAISMWLQPGGADTVHPVRKGEDRFLYYTLPEFGLRLRFRPTDFTQVNVHINRLLIRRAMQLLDPRPGERIADLFCGLGNFSLPVAARGAAVIGVEGSAVLTRRAAENAAVNGLDERCDFRVANLFEATEKSVATMGRLDKMLIDPPREGAVAVCRALGDKAPRRIVYVSCNPGTLARDAAVLVHEKGYHLRAVGVANMFPQTSHVESIALFERG